jgi:hypothetical protein
MPNLCEKYKFTILSRHYHNTQVFTEMPRHLRKCQNYDITANIHAFLEYLLFFACACNHMLLLWCLLHNWQPCQLTRAAMRKSVRNLLHSGHAPYYIWVYLHDGIHANPRHPTDYCAGNVISGTLATVASRMAKIRADLQDGIHASSRHPRSTLGEKCAIR